MKYCTSDVPHTVRHTRRNGLVVMVTEAHAKRLYRRMDMPPNYPVPAIRYHVDSGRTGVAIWNNSTVYDYSTSDYFNERPVFEYP